MKTQSVEIDAEYSFDRATEVIMDLILDGFSVEAECKDNRWYISAEKPNESIISISGRDLDLASNNDR